MLNPYQHPVYIETFRIVEERLCLFINDRDAFINIALKGAQFHLLQNAEARANNINSGWFSKEMMAAVISGGKEYKTGPLDYIWRSLVSAQCVIEHFGSIGRPFYDSDLCVPVIKNFIETDNFQNIFYPPSNFVKRYSDAIVSIDVLDINKKERRGSGFIFSDTEAKKWLCTAYHNIKDNKIVSIRNGKGEIVEIGEVLGISEADVSFSPIVSPISGPTFKFFKDLELFDDIYTFGFPLVPCVDSVLIGHRGELNGVGKNYINKTDTMIISNLISPGSSGGPILNKYGFCVGMSAAALEGHIQSEGLQHGPLQRFSAGIPFYEIEKAFRELRPQFISLR